MTVVTVDDLHTVADPVKRLRDAALIAGIEAGADASRLIVRVPDRRTDGVRVYRPNDVARMLQRHGRIRELAVTDGGTIVAAADVCKRRGEVAVWTGKAIGGWHPTDILQRGLGGSETAAVRLSEQLAEMGYVVTLYGDFAQTGMVGDILLRHWAEFDASEPIDALVGFRNAMLFDHRPAARTCILWLEDLAPAEALTPARAANIDRIVPVSHFHAKQLHDVHPWIDPKQVAVSRNAIVPAWFDPQPGLEREKRVLFTSSPDRGADVVLELWPRVRERVPDAQLVLTYAAWFDIVASNWQKAGDFKERMVAMLQQPGVHRIEGGLGQRSLAQLMASSLCWVHPSWYSDGVSPDGSPGQEFWETQCISCWEAQAAGCVVVASNWGALAENVFYGTLIDGDPREPEGEWRDAFVEAIVAGLTDENVQTMAQTLGPEYVRDMDWRGAAEQLAAMFEPAPQRKVGL